MGRSGGGGGGGHHSSGGHSSHRSSGGHSFSGGRSGGFSGGRSGGGGFSSHYRSSRTNVYVNTPVSSSYRRRYGEHYYNGGSGVSVGAIIYFLLICIIMVMLASYAKGPTVKNYKNRLKINSGYTFMNDCIYDDIDWIYSESTMRDGLKHFHDKTGVQPVVILHQYEPTMSYDDMEQNTVQIYEDMYNDREDIFLYVYYDSAPEDDDDGYSTYCAGTLASTVMDDDAIDIFWELHDHYWYGSTYASGEEDEMFAAIFKKTADTIMEKSANMFSVITVGIIAVVVIAILVTIIIVIKSIHKRKKEEAEETARILNADIDTLSSSSEDDLVNKYN